eukprot:scaffold7052_cov254-Pinguiococcus_pyrenoidosus.AAC.126
MQIRHGLEGIGDHIQALLLAADLLAPCEVLQHFSTGFEAVEAAFVAQVHTPQVLREAARKRRIRRQIEQTSPLFFPGRQVHRLSHESVGRDSAGAAFHHCKATHGRTSAQSPRLQREKLRTRSAQEDQEPAHLV